MDYMQRGGPLMWLILFCSVVAVAVFAERLLYFHRVSINVSEFLRGLANLLERRNVAEARQECAGAPGPVARVLHAALLRQNESRAELREIVQDAGQLEVPRLERNLPVLSTIAFVTPLIGLLGTVAGLIDAFVAISTHNGYASATDVSGGVYQSLLTTAAGLAVAIPAAVAHSYLSSRVNGLLHDMERAGIEIVHLITEKREGAEIIDFEARRKLSAE